MIAGYEKIKMKGLLIALLLIVTLSSFASADVIIFKDGRKIETERAWEEEGQIKCYRYGGIVGYPKTQVERIEKEELEKEKAIVPAIRRKEVTPLVSRETCYELGYRYGLCATKSMNEIPCKPENDIVIPARCRGKAETKRGISAGVKVVYDILNLDSGSSRSSSSLNMLTTPLDVLTKRLKGKTKSEVKRLVGSPDRIEVFAGKKCWVYGTTYTSKDRGIVFHGERVLMVTFY